MNDRPVTLDALDAELRRTLGTLDVGPGFAARLASEIDALRTANAAEARAAARDRCRAERTRAARALRRELRTRLVHAAGLGAAALAGAWLLRGAAAHLYASLAAPAHQNGKLLALASAAALIAWLVTLNDAAGRDQARFG